ncbi:MAG: hypothetical protein A4E35_00658 [Methanoregula sp. PtaU1.Bin051]|nr:MAG: hypothetical protein A4E35_00658 [Methanoregula sp. PtaU1.Bin051]
MKRTSLIVSGDGNGAGNYYSKYIYLEIVIVARRNRLIQSVPGEQTSYYEIKSFREVKEWSKAPSNTMRHSGSSS